MVGVVEMLGDGDQVREPFGGEFGDVSARGVCRRFAGLTFDLDTELCRLVEGKAVDDREQEALRCDREFVRDASSSKDPEQALGDAKRVRPHWDPADRDTNDVAVAEDHSTRGASHLLELLSPALRFGLGHLYLAGASGVFNTAQQLGGAIGVAALGTIFFGHAESHSFSAAFTHTVPYVAVAFLLAAALALVLPKTAVAEEHAGA